MGATKDAHSADGSSKNLNSDELQNVFYVNYHEHHRGLPPKVHLDDVQTTGVGLVDPGSPKLTCHGF